MKKPTILAILLAAALIAAATALFRGCTEVPDYCGDGVFNFGTHFCYDNTPTPKCGKVTFYNPNEYECKDGSLVSKPKDPPVDSTPPPPPQKTQFTIIYDGNENTDGAAPVDTVRHDSAGTITLKDRGTLERTGYKFNGWSTTREGTSPYGEGAQFVIRQNTTLYAAWVSEELATYFVIVDGGTGGGYHVEGATVEITANTPEGKQFDKWTSLNNDDVSFDDETNPVTWFVMPTMPENADTVKVTANFKLIEYTITYNYGDGTPETPNPETYTIETGDFTLNNPQRLGYTFKGWSGTGLGDVIYKNVTVYTNNPGNREYTANWEAVRYKIEYDNGDINGTVSHNNRVEYTVADLPITLNPAQHSGDGDYQFVCWIYEDNCISEIPVGTMEDLKFWAKWNDNSHPVVPEPKCSLTVSVSSSGGGTTSPAGKHQVDCNIATSIQASPEDGYGFDNWTKSGSGVGTIADANRQTTTVTVTTGNVTVTASFSPVSGGTSDTGTVYDKAGKGYRYVTIGGKKWMAENLNYRPNQSTGIRCYKDSPDSCNKYGALYTWETAQTVCPSGWHLPSRVEWDSLASAVGGTKVYSSESSNHNWNDAGNMLKSTSGWNREGNGTDNFRFSALPGGSNSDNSFNEVGNHGYWWTASVGSSGNAYYREMNYNDNNVNEHYDDQSNGFSVRCVSD